MSDNKPERITYERERRKVKISGNAKDVKWAIWIEQLRPVIILVLLVILVALGIIKGDSVAVLWKSIFFPAGI